MSEKANELYEKVQGKVDTLKDEDSVYAKFADIWRLACLGKYRSYDLRYLYEDTSREYIEKYKPAMIEAK